MKIDPTGKALGATIEKVDLAQPLSDGDFKRILRALGEHGVLCFPRQQLETDEFARFGRMFGELEVNVANQFHEPGFPEVMVLSNMTADGRPIGLADAGQGWHTDMSYSRDIALANVLYALKVPAARAARWAILSSATCVPPTTICPPKSKRGSRDAPPPTTSPSSGT
jgi:taurine dioxygenase